MEKLQATQIQKAAARVIAHPGTTVTQKAIAQTMADAAKKGEQATPMAIVSSAMDALEATTKATSKAKPRNASPKAATPNKGIQFAMLQGYRPAGGSALYAHTAAALELFGMDKGAHVPKARLAIVLGDTAVKHHLNKTGFFEQDANGVTVSELGKDAFLIRSIDPEQKAAFVEILTTGKTSKALPATYTNPKGVKAI